ncbi:uncharacterized protein LOC111089435 [Limulus polyphemus]|uniref:Uncharacterized protein LOC111089435 n=1 Tax=Limulus polyphemus TaxID=6850 RepID=A0ABM1TP49_LIMPO|nr:uncharacterized protein LOC111089435 [Limulus polyphemus]
MFKSVVFNVLVLITYVNSQNSNPGQHRRALVNVIRAFSGLCANTTGLNLDSCIMMLEAEDGTEWNSCLTTGGFTDNAGFLTAACDAQRNIRTMIACVRSAARTNWRNERRRIITATRSLRPRQRRTQRRQMRNDYFSPKITAANNAQACLTVLAG